ncbi:unnamed protein product [Camellia sinensis]
MNLSHPSVHPVEAPPALTEGENVPRVRMKDIQGMPGTIGGVTLRLSQFVFAIVSFSVMVTTSDFPSVTAFCYLVAAVGLQSLWSLSLAVVDIYALLVGRCLQNYRVVSLFAIGDGVCVGVIMFVGVITDIYNKTLVVFLGNNGITSTLTFAAACASAGITVLIGNDLGICSQNHCAQFETATAMAFLCWFTALPSFLLNFWSLASR